MVRRTSSGARLSKIRKRNAGKGRSSGRHSNKQRLAKNVLLEALREAKQKERLETLLKHQKQVLRSSLNQRDVPRNNETDFEQLKHNDDYSEDDHDPKESYAALLRLLPAPKVVTESSIKKRNEEDDISMLQGGDADDIGSPRQTGKLNTDLPLAYELRSAHFSKKLPADASTLLQHGAHEYSKTSKLGNVRISTTPKDTSMDVKMFPRSRSELGLLPGILEKWEKMRVRKHNFGDVEAAVSWALKDWKDVLVCAGQSREELRDIYVGHGLSHVVRARRRVMKGNKIARKDGEGGKDQGYTRARIIWIVGMKNSAFELVERVRKLAVGVVKEDEDFDGEDGDDDANKSGLDVAQIANWGRFVNEYGPGDGKETKEETWMERDCAGSSASSRDKSSKRNKCIDYDYVFRGNIGDDFKIGMAVTRKTLKLYTDFYSSDIIVASPLGLRRALEAKALKGRDVQGDDVDVNEESDDSTADFLSSIEMCVIDECEILAMQNWESLLFVLRRLNCVPKKPGDTDFSRVYDWALDALMECYRQTLVLAAYPKPEVFAMFRSFRNHSGSMKVVETPPEIGVMKSVSIRVKQTFYYVPDVATPDVGPDRRFDFFTKKILPALRTNENAQTIVFIPSYYDLVRVRNHMVQLTDDDQDFKFGSISEYTKMGDVTRIRGFFFNRRIRILLVTERLYFYRRYHIRGANRVLFYGVPENAQFYKTFVEMLKEAKEKGMNVEVLALYDQWDQMAIERVVGRKKAKRMTGNMARESYMFEDKNDS